MSVVIGARTECGKALTTYDDFSRGVLDALAVAAENHELMLRELLGATRLLVNGTTVVTNAITTLQGSSVGVIVTGGFRDRFRFGGGPRRTEFDDHLQTNLPDLAARTAIVAVPERINYAGEVVVALDEAQLREQVTYLADEEKVEAISVCFLSSFANPAHELRAEAIISEMHPGRSRRAGHDRQLGAAGPGVKRPLRGRHAGLQDGQGRPLTGARAV